jgi:hypothetical protein
VSVFNVVWTGRRRQYFDVLFDKPVGQGKVGEVLDPAPAKIYPVLGGSWKWQTTNALRFQASGGLPVASEYKVTLDPAKIVKEGQVFTGDTELTVKTGQVPGRGPWSCWELGGRVTLGVSIRPLQSAKGWQ